MISTVDYGLLRMEYDITPHSQAKLGPREAYYDESKYIILSLLPSASSTAIISTT